MGGRGRIGGHSVNHARETLVNSSYRLGARNLDTLRQQLCALDRPRLLKNIAAFNLNPAGKNITAFSDDQLVTFILKAGRAQLAQRAR